VAVSDIESYNSSVIDYTQFKTSELVAECVASKELAVWREFVRRFHPLIAGVVARAAARWVTVSAPLIDDLVQETYVKICAEDFRRLREFESQHEDAIFGYLKSIAYTVTLDHFKVHYASKRGVRLRSGVDVENSLRVVGQKSSVEREILLRELEEMAGQGAEEKRDKLVFALYYRQGFSTAKIARIRSLGLSQKGVESCLHRLTERLRKRVAGGNY
jgi:RNA polymerase sigma-70 factor (ECF subfamily)